MRLNISYSTEYGYDEPVKYGLQRLRLTPSTRTGQAVIDWRTELEGATEEVSYRDHFNNPVTLISAEPGTHAVSITASGEVETENLHGVVGTHSNLAPLWLFQRETDLTTKTRAIAAMTRELTEEEDVPRMHQLMALIAERVEYGSGATDVTTTADQALAAGRGVCQDHTHIFLTAARALGYPARYVSGFLMMDGQTHQAASHAWPEVYLDQLGWVGYDVSNGISPDDRYVCLATGLDYRDAAPISGIRHGFSSETLAVQVIVEQ
ncbi:transglutaminase family protein [Mariluticola halotolerans]|uniref:transglutaminase family protein n=1 Tax=Mariluticola halotolerans TaxID=2909283 RepID=UPI0026E44921|nr:transglutaminase family protein [Mariluticola halotolerans]UJQ94353.1 transglutaminase family protein [Mariluticola halotolerans]